MLEGDGVQEYDLLCKIPVLGKVRRQVLQTERLVSCRKRCAYYASFPGLATEGDEHPALIATGGSLSLKRDRPRGYIFLGKFDAEWLGACSSSPWFS